MVDMYIISPDVRNVVRFKEAGSAMSRVIVMLRRVFVARSKVLVVLLSLALLAMVLTGCLSELRDKASIQALMNDLDDHDFEIFGQWTSSDVDFEVLMGDWEVALGYFADPISIGIASSGNNPGRIWKSSAEFDHSLLLYYELDWDLEDYKDHIRKSEGLESEDAYPFLATFIDGNFDPILYLGLDKEDSDLRITESVVRVRGNTATWTKGYAVQGPVNAWKREASLNLEVDLKKGTDSKWKISHVQFAWHTDDTKIEN